MLPSLFYLARDFVRIQLGRDYFHQPQPLGLHFRDSRCYYNDLRGKAHWAGPRDEDVPVLFLPQQNRRVFFPITILNFGLGSLDCYYTSGETRYRAQAESAARWVVRHLNAEGYLDNLFPELEPDHRYHSSNSGMAQGEALSLLTRVHREIGAHPDPASTAFGKDVEGAIAAVRENLLKPLEEGGTVLAGKGPLVFCEVCRTDEYVVLNGWIYALFGLLDYSRWSGDERARDLFHESARLMGRELDSYAMAQGWSRYDNKGRVCSPFYHRLHIHLLDAMFRLTGDRAFAAALERFRGGDRIGNRVRFTIRKVADKLTDRVVYGTQG